MFKKHSVPLEKTMKYVFGPVPSRRLGQSLGVDTIPSKTCNWNCVYCQLGRTQPMVNVRAEYFPREAILAEIRQSLASHAKGEIDWITFVGSGEPTLHLGIGWLIREIKKITQIPIAVITNGSLLYLPELRAELLPADAILPTLDAGDAETYKKINRPLGELSFERLVDGLIALRAEYEGKLWVETMLIKGVNDSLAALGLLAETLAKIRPNAVHLNLPTRPPAETWVQPPDEEALLRASAVLGEIAQIVTPIQGEFDLSGYENIADAVLSIVTRHPMRENQLVANLARWCPDEISETLSKLSADGRIQVVERYGVRFWSVTQAHYAKNG